MALPWRLALKAIPWATILANAPVIARSAGILLSETKADRGPAEPRRGELQNVAARVSALEERDREVALLLAQMTSQIAALTTATEVLEARVRWLLVGMIATSAVALAAFAVGVLGS
jgi:hypothetical protein